MRKNCMRLAKKFLKRGFLISDSTLQNQFFFYKKRITKKKKMVSGIKIAVFIGLVVGGTCLGVGIWQKVYSDDMRDHSTKEVCQVISYQSHFCTYKCDCSEDKNGNKHCHTCSGTSYHYNYNVTSTDRCFGIQYPRSQSCSDHNGPRWHMYSYTTCYVWDNCSKVDFYSPTYHLVLAIVLMSIGGCSCLFPCCLFIVYEGVCIGNCIRGIRNMSFGMSGYSTVNATHSEKFNSYD